MDYVHKWFAAWPHHDKLTRTRPKIKLRSGVVISVQASTAHECLPQSNNAERYTHVEVHMPREIKRDYPLLADWYSYGKDPEHKRPQWFVNVPVALVNRYIHDNGGILERASDEKAFWKSGAGIGQL
jgi:hypothetical protein